MFPLDEQTDERPGVMLMSFGFKYGLPRANYYFDVGFIKNPARDPRWDFFSGADERMRSFVLEQKDVQRFIELTLPLLKLLAGLDQNQVFAFGCSAGRHRSTILVEELSRLLEESGIRTHVYHRDLHLNAAGVCEPCVGQPG
jgi:UPF0042 nucleotide-binding protein